LTVLKEQLATGQETLNRIVVKTGNKLAVIPVGEIVLLEAANDYVEIHTARYRYLKQQSLTYFENHLPKDRFIRVHRSFIVAVDEISTIEPYTKENYVLMLKNKREISVSRAGMKLLRERLNI